jgi:hypothetical protein
MPVDPMDVEHEECSTYTLKVIDIFTLAQENTFIHHNIEEPLAASLVRAGYLPPTPSKPNVAISIRTLELYHHLHLRQPSFSAQAFAKVCCDLYSEPYERYIRDVISLAYDVYVAIRRKIRKVVMAKLGRDGPNWRVQNACPPCSLEVSAIVICWGPV